MARTHPSPIVYDLKKDGMKQGDVGWSEKRRQSSRALAYYFDSRGWIWSSLREAARRVASDLGISTTKKRRSQIAVECMEKLSSMGIIPPFGYVPPWLRNAHQPVILRQSARRLPKEDTIRAFYDSFEWKRLRFAILTSRGRRCQCCGADWRTATIHVDHIKPLKKRWDLRLDPDNLQVLCEWCNQGKGSKYETDFRQEA